MNEEYFTNLWIGAKEPTYNVALFKDGEITVKSITRGEDGCNEADQEAQLIGCEMLDHTVISINGHLLRAVVDDISAMDENNHATVISKMTGKALYGNVVFEHYEPRSADAFPLLDWELLLLKSAIATNKKDGTKAILCD